MARRLKYTPQIADFICEAIATGGALYLLCKKKDMPAERTVYQWLEKYEDFAQKYTRARERQQDYEADHIVEIADNAKDANVARLQIDARKWRASKLAPKKYGDKLNLDVKQENPVEKATYEEVTSVLAWIGEQRKLSGQGGKDIPCAPEGDETS